MLSELVAAFARPIQAICVTGHIVDCFIDGVRVNQITTSRLLWYGGALFEQAAYDCKEEQG